MGRLGGTIFNMPKVARIRIAVAAFVLALTWGTGFQVSGVTHIPFAFLCFVTGSVALAYIVWESHRTWRASFKGNYSGPVSYVQGWPGLRSDQLSLRPEIISAATVLLLCGIGIWQFLHLNEVPRDTGNPAVPTTNGNPSPTIPRIRADVVRLLGELPTLSALMERGLPLNKDLADLLTQQPRLITLSLSVGDAISQVRALQDKFAALRADFYAFLSDHAYDRAELEKLVDWTNNQANNPRRRGEEFGVIVVDLGNYANELTRLPGNLSTSNLLQTQVVWVFYVSLNEDQKRFYYWIMDTKMRINSKRAELQEALKSAQ